MHEPMHIDPWQEAIDEAIWEEIEAIVSPHCQLPPPPPPPPPPPRYGMLFWVRLMNRYFGAFELRAQWYRITVSCRSECPRNARVDDLCGD